MCFKISVFILENSLNFYKDSLYLHFKTLCYKVIPIIFHVIQVLALLVLRTK